MSNELSLINLPRGRKPITYKIKNDCWICDSHGKSDSYCTIKINKKIYRIHRMVASIYYNMPYDSDLVVRHLCHQKACLNPLHLRFGTQKENIDDNIRDQRHLKGEKIGQSLLKKEEVYKIKELIVSTNIPLRHIGKMFGVSDNVMWAINNECDWKHIKVENFKPRKKCNKLSSSEIKEMTDLYLNGIYNKTELSKLYNINRKTVYNKLKAEIERQKEE